MPRPIAIAQLADVLPPGGLTLVSGCSAESALLAEAVTAAGEALGPMTFSGVFVSGLNRRTWLANPDCRLLTFFMTPELRAIGDQVEFLPICYQDVLAELRRRRPAAMLFMCSPPDEDGRCSFGTEVSFIADLWPDIPVRIAHINPMMPRTRGDPGIPFDSITAYLEGDQPLLGFDTGSADPVAEAIAGHVAHFVDDGAALQTGLGKIPDATLRALKTRRALRVHTGLMGDGVLDLIESGSTADGPSVVAGTAIGSERLYRGLDHPSIQFRPVSHTHGVSSLAAITGLVTINSAIKVDLFGQAYAELTPKGLMSGPGGASDFARGARSSNGLRIIALPAGNADGNISRIIAPGAAAEPVSLGRMDVDIVITEHGVADLRCKSHHARAEALIGIAPPTHRAALDACWTDFSRKL